MQSPNQNLRIGTTVVDRFYAWPVVAVHRCSSCSDPREGSVNCGINGDFERTLRTKGQFPPIIPSPDSPVSKRKQLGWPRLPGAYRGHFQVTLWTSPR
jgi:hypothetical protein